MYTVYILVRYEVTRLVVFKLITGSDIRSEIKFYLAVLTHSSHLFEAFVVPKHVEAMQIAPLRSCCEAKYKLLSEVTTNCFRYHNKNRLNYSTEFGKENWKI